MISIEQEYQRHIQALPPAARLARMHLMLGWVRDLYARQLRQQLGQVSEERLKWEVALRQYGADPRTRELIEGRLRDVRS